MLGLLLAAWTCLLPARSARLSQLQASHPLPLCHQHIVDETCELLSNSGKAFRRGATGKIDVLSFGELQGALHTTFDSLANYMEFIGLDGRTGFMVNCMELCNLTVASLPPTRTPPASDVACYSTAAGVVCDIDVSDAGYEDVYFETENRNGTSKFERSEAVAPVIVEVGNGTFWSPDLEPVDPEDRDEMPENVGLDQLRISIANLFRIFPPFELEVTEGNSSEVSDDPPIEANATLGPAATSVLQQGLQITDEDCFDAVPGAVLRKHSFWLTIAFSGRKCKCPRGTVLSGQSSRCRSGKYAEDRRKFDPDELSGRRCYCQVEDKVRENIPPSCADKFPTGFKDRYYRRQTCHDLKQQCHKRGVYEVCPKTCRTTCLLDGDGDEETKEMVKPEEPWKREVAKTAVKAQAYTMKAIRAMGRHRGGSLIRKWFGDSDEWTREKVLRVLNGIHRLLSNVDFMYPGRSCDASDFAYVYAKPPGNRNRRGRYVFHLCEKYMTSSTSTKIETLTHEASHHETMYTDDMCADGSHRKGCKKAYGRRKCEELAHDDPDEAQTNADNYCFFINDMAGADRHRH